MNHGLLFPYLANALASVVVAHTLVALEGIPRLDGPAYVLADDLVVRILVEMVVAHILEALEGIPRLDDPAYVLADDLVVHIPVEMVDVLLPKDVVCPQVFHRDLLHARHQSPDTEQLQI